MSYRDYAYSMILEWSPRTMKTVDDSGGLRDVTIGRKSRPVKPGPGTQPSAFEANLRQKRMAPTPSAPAAPPTNPVAKSGGLLSRFKNMSTLGKVGVAGAGLAAGYGLYRHFNKPTPQPMRSGRRYGGYR